ncbi:MAG: tetratricopeptide repeat protein [Pirellulales bacterium]|nr:tetratricopeptide repeat protein [Pirellulales bacterium]
MSTGSPRGPRLLDLYQKYLDNQDSAGFITRVSRAYTQGTLQRLVSHANPQIRRAAVLALGFLGDYEVNGVLGRALNDDDRTVRMLVENGIRSVWARAGNDEQRQQLGIVIRLNAAQHYDEARSRASELIHSAPWFAEAWNQRALAEFAMGRYTEAIRDCHEALEINPYHFAAAAGMGQAYLQLGNQVSALECFRRALRLNPDLEGVRAQVARLARLIEDR